jgi:hypothetical protein
LSSWSMSLIISVRGLQPLHNVITSTTPAITNPHHPQESSYVGAG